MKDHDKELLFTTLWIILIGLFLTFWFNIFSQCETENVKAQYQSERHGQ